MGRNIPFRTVLNLLTLGDIEVYDPDRLPTGMREDYLLSNKFRKYEMQMHLSQHRQKAAETRGVASDQADMAIMESFLIQDGSYFDASKSEMVYEYGSIEAYISEGLGLSDREFQHLRK